jgi:innexin
MFDYRRILNTKTGVDLMNYVQVLHDDKKNDAENSPAIKYVVKNMEKFLNFRDNYAHQNFFKDKVSRFLPLTSGVYIVISYFLVKFLYLAVALGQLVLLNYWFKDVYYSEIGWPTLFGDYNWRLTERFPRMTLCNFDVYQLTDKQTHWIQCTLPINLYIEKIYLIIWFWLWLLLGIITLNILNYIYLLTTRNKDFVNNRYDVDPIEKNEDNNESNNDELQVDMSEDFVKYLKPDGILLLRLLKINTSSLYVSVILSKLYHSFVQKRNKKK